jgi:hypothetical protein
MMPPESLVSDATIWSVTLESSIMILEASFALIYEVYNTFVTYGLMIIVNQSAIDNHNMFTVQATD